MKRKKIKLALIDDYIKICQIKNFSNNSFSNFELAEKSKLREVKNLSILLEKTYVTLFETLKLNDLSLCILQKELEQNNSLFLNTNSQNIDKILDVSLLSLQNIISNLKSKVLDLKINFSLEVSKI